MHVFTETARLRLRRFVDADLGNLVALENDPGVKRYVDNGRPVPREQKVEDLAGFVESYARYGGLGWFAADDRESGAFIGWFGLHPPDPARPHDMCLGYRLRTAWWGRGMATEGARYLVDLGFTEYAAERIHADAMAVNVASRRVMEKAGLRHERTDYLEFDEPIPGTEFGDVVYSVTRAEWEANRVDRAGHADRLS